MNPRTIRSPQRIARKTRKAVRGFRRRSFGLYTVVSLCCSLIPNPHAHAAVTEAWVHRYSNVASNAFDFAVKVVRDTAGDFVVTGNTAGGGNASDMVTIKYSGADGSELWQKHSPATATSLAVDGGGNILVTGYSVSNSNTGYYTAKYAATDGTLLWEQHYFSSGDGNITTAMAVDSSGNVAVTGYSWDDVSGFDYYTAKYAAANGALLWEKRYNGPANGFDYARGMAVDNDGNVLVTGYSWNGSNNDYYTVKYASSDGVLLWERRCDGPADSYDQGVAVAVDGSGNAIVTGYSKDDYYTAKYSAANGSVLWQQRYAGPASGYDRPSAIAVDSSGNVIVTGYSHNSQTADYYTAKYAATNGVLMWERRYDGPVVSTLSDDFADAVAVDSYGNVVVTGISGGFGNGGDYYTAKYAAADGALLWQKRYNGLGNSADQARSVAIDDIGDVVVTGWSDNGRRADYYTAKYAEANGALLWEKRYTGPAKSDDQAQAVAVDGAGNVAVTGLSDNGSNNDFYTAKYAAANGALVWEKRYDGPASRDDEGRAMGVDSNGNVVVTGFSYSTNLNFDSNENADYYTAKYAATNGALLWEQRYDGPEASYDEARALAVDSSGNVAVTGFSYNTNFNSDYYTAKYAAANGALLWERRYDSAQSGEDEARAISVDNSGNVIVTGFSWNGTNSDYYTAKYAAADGAVLWQKWYNGPGNGYDDAEAVAVDNSGNVVVTGHALNGMTGDYYTAKYSAADGALLWERFYNGPANKDDYAVAVAIDPGGNVVVTGTSQNGIGPETADYYTAKYAAADGAVLWEKRYNGPDSDHDHGVAVATDAIGNVIVTGSSERDSLTIKYAGTDGALLWEKRSNYRPNGNYSPSSLAVGPNGMVAITGTFTDENDETDDYATVVYREGLGIELVPTGVRLHFTGTPGHSYNIERAPTVTGPWSIYVTLAAPPNGIMEYVDTNGPPIGSAFYRTSTP